MAVTEKLVPDFALRIDGSPAPGFLKSAVIGVEVHQSLELAREEGLEPEVEDTKLVHEYLLQNNQSNIDFIHELARRTFHEVEVAAGEKKLLFRKPRSKAQHAHALTWGRDLKSFYVRK